MKKPLFSPIAARRLARALVHMKPILTKEVKDGFPVYLVPTYLIKRREGKYTDFRKTFNAATDHIYDMNKHDRIKELRSLVRKNIPMHTPIALSTKDWKSFILYDGHHRLTAHQAEGKKFIRATINGMRTSSD